MTSLHALCLTPENRVLSLPEWGQGRGTGRDRHERRVRRYRSRCSGFLKNIEQRGAFGGVDDSGLRHLMDVVDERLESDLEELAGLGTSLIHADLHAENLVFNGESVSILDWQTCSYGPIVYETVRFLAESLRGPDAFDRFESELAAHKMLMTQRGFPDDVLSTLETSIERCLRVSFAGMVSGYGRLGAVSKHDATIAWWLASDGGLAEIMKRRFLLDITLTAPPDCT